MVGGLGKELSVDTLGERVVFVVPRLRFATFGDWDVMVFDAEADGAWVEWFCFERGHVGLGTKGPVPLVSGVVARVGR